MSAFACAWQPGISLVLLGSAILALDQEASHLVNAGFAKGVRRAEVHVLKDAQGALTPEIMNSRDEPDRVRVFTRRAEMRADQIVLSFEPFNLTLYELTLEKGESR